MIVVAGGEHPVGFSAVGMKHLAACRNIEHLEFYDCDLGAAARCAFPPHLNQPEHC